MFNNFFFFFENRAAIYDIVWKNMVERDRPQMTVWLMRIACWIPKATNIHPQYVILIAFPMRQWLHEHAWTLRCTCMAYLVVFYYPSLFILLNFFLYIPLSLSYNQKQLQR